MDISEIKRYGDKELNFKGILLAHMDRISEIVTTRQNYSERAEEFIDVYKRSVGFFEDVLSPFIDEECKKELKEMKGDEIEKGRLKFRALMCLMSRLGMLMKKKGEEYYP